MRKVEKKCEDAKDLRLEAPFVDYSTMSEDDILEYMLSYIAPVKDVKTLAGLLLNEFNSLANVLDANVENLKQVKGVGDVVANYLNFCSRLPEIYKMSRTKKEVKIKGPKALVEYLTSMVEFSAIEKFYYICLDGKGRVTHLGSVGSGSITKLFVNNRDLISQILKRSAHSVAICHTHPFGLPNPSEEDRKYTKELKNLLSSLSISLVDHVILSPDGYFSFFQSHLLEVEPVGEMGATYRDMKAALGDGGIEYNFEEDKNDD
jgi:DNA repair protein RadC